MKDLSIPERVKRIQQYIHSPSLDYDKRSNASDSYTTAINALHAPEWRKWRNLSGYPHIKKGML